MSADLLREAAALMRKRADKATTGDVIRGDHWHHDLTWMSKRFEVIATDEGSVLAEGLDRWTAEHIASWHPAVAHAVADWLEGARCRLHCGPDGMRSPYCPRCEDSGDDHECPPRSTCDHTPDFGRAVTVARAYLGRAS